MLNVIMKDLTPWFCRDPVVLPGWSSFLLKTDGGGNYFEPGSFAFDSPFFTETQTEAS